MKNIIFILAISSLISCEKDRSFSENDLQENKLYTEGKVFQMSSSLENDTLKFIVDKIIIEDHSMKNVFGNKTKYQHLVTNFLVYKNDEEIGQGTTVIKSLDFDNTIDVNFSIKPCGSYYTSLKIEGSETITIHGVEYSKVNNLGGIYVNKENGILIMNGCSVLKLLP